MIHHVRLLAFSLCGAAMVASAQSNGPSDPLKNGFQNPPESARPRVWWHWMNGNISKEGIKLDLEWMHRSGLAGFQNFDAALQTPQVVDQRLAYMTPEWKDAFKICDRTRRSARYGNGDCRLAGLERDWRPVGTRQPKE